jgi:hypothetical protein
MKKYKVIKGFFVSSAHYSGESWPHLTEVSFVKEGSILQYYGGANDAPEGYYDVNLGFKMRRFTLNIVEGNPEYFELIIP